MLFGPTQKLPGPAMKTNEKEKPAPVTRIANKIVKQPLASNDKSKADPGFF